MPRTLRASFAMLACAFVASCGERKPETPAAEAPAPAPIQPLRVGYTAPPLTGGRWVQGPEVQGFEPGKVYVVDFWAPWSPQSAMMLPHLGRLQQRYRDKG